MDAAVYGSMTPLAPVAATTTRAKIAAADTAARRVVIQLDPDADKKCFIGDATVLANGSVGVLFALKPGQSAELPVNSTQGLYVVMFTGSAGASLYVSVLK